MYYFFYGENSYLMVEKIKAIGERFEQVVGDSGEIVRLDGSKMIWGDFVETVFGSSLFKLKKLIQVKNLISEGNSGLQSQIKDSLDKIPADFTVIFTEDGIPDGRNSLFKLMLKSKNTQRFDNLTPIAVQRWIRERVQKKEVMISSEAVNLLQLLLGADLWRLENELEKLSLYRRSMADKTISRSDIEAIVRAEQDPNLFGLTDAVAARNFNQALAVLQRLKMAGESEIYLLSMIVNQYRQMLKLESLLFRGVPASGLAAAAKVHPFVAKKICEFLKRQDRKNLRLIYKLLLRCDRRIKSGAVEAPIILDLLVAKACGK